MRISVEISYYPLIDNYEQPIMEFIDHLSDFKNISITMGQMSSIISGEYDEIMDILTQALKPYMEKYPSVFTIKMANACKECKLEE